MKKCLLFVLITVLLFTACSSKEEGSSEDIIGNSGLPEYIDLTVHELDDDCFIFVRNNEEKMLSFEYISDHEFEAGDKKFILAN